MTKNQNVIIDCDLQSIFLISERFFKIIFKRGSFDTPRAKRKIIKYYKVNLYGLHIVRPRAVMSQAMEKEE